MNASERGPSGPAPGAESGGGVLAALREKGTIS
jgi:hypothetical protein